MGEHDELVKKPTPAQAAAARVGTALNAKWWIDRLLGVGGMGAVFAVTHRNNGSKAAAKLLHAEYVVNRDVLERFLREGKIANSVDHQARVLVFDDDVSDLGEPFLVMELLEGTNLSELLHRKGGRIPAEEALRIFDPVLDLLTQCHAANIVHRDIKPANVFLTKAAGAPWGAVKVLDFGVARMREPEAGVEATRAGVALGTASYIAPEQALGAERVDGRADLFSVGACLFTAISGIRLHKAHTEAEEFILAATQTAPSIGRYAPELPPEVVAFVDKALAYDRLRRYQNATEMRSDLLRLLGGLRSGQLKVGAGRKVAGVVVRGNELLDEGERTESEQAAAADRLTGIFRALGHTMASVRQYGFAHPQTQKSLAQAYGDIGAALVADPAGVSWDVTPGAFVVYGKPVWQPDRVPFDRIPHQLFADGIRRVQLKPGLDERELGDFLAIVLRDTSSGFGAEDDSVTALWDRRFEHIAYLAVDSFAEAEEGDDDATRAEWDAVAQRAMAFARIDKDWDDSSAEAQASEINLASSLREAGEAAAALAVDPLTRATLGAQIVLPAEQWQERYVDVFVQAYLEARRGGDVVRLLGALKEWAADQVALKAASHAFEMYREIGVALSVHLDAEAYEAAELAITHAMFPVETLRVILAEMAAQRGEGAQQVIRPQVVAGLGRALDLLDSGAVFGLACECLGSTRSEALREVLHAYVARWINGQEAMVSTMLGSAGRELGLALVALLAELATPRATAVLEAAFKNPNVEIQLSALSHLSNAPAEKVRDVAGRILEHSDASVRADALALVGKLQVVAAGPVLVRRIQSDAFHDMPVEERRRWLEALVALKSARAEAIAIELLSKRQILSSSSLDQSRVLAAEMLATASSDEAIAALQSAAQKRWGNSEQVREAAGRSLAAAQARRMGGGIAMEGKP